MSIDATQVGVISADLMDRLADDYDDTDVVINNVLVLVEVTGTDDDGDRWTGIEFRCSDPRGWVQRGLLHEALR